MSDLTDRLRSFTNSSAGTYDTRLMAGEAADRIAALEAAISEVNDSLDNAATWAAELVRSLNIDITAELK